MVKRKGGRKLEHFPKNWIEIARNVVFLVVYDSFVSNLHLDVGVRFAVRILRLKVNTLECVSKNSNVSLEILFLFPKVQGLD